MSVRWPDLRAGALAAALLHGACAQASAAASETQTIRVGPAYPVTTIAEAARLARDGDTVEVQAGVYRGDVAVWRQAELTIRAIGGPAVLVADGRSAEGKAIWVIRNGEFEIEGFDFVGARVPHRNGAGIRFEGGRLTVRDSRFIDNQMGILTGNDGLSELVIEGCEFSGPTDGDRWYHNLYVGAIARLTVSASWFHSGRRGHLLKSRARENIVHYNRLTDEEGNASYELEFPNGGWARVVGNLIEQAPRTDNRTIVAFGAEGYRWSDNRLQMAHNTVVNRAGSGTFLRVWPGPAAVELYNNLWAGPGDFRLSAGTVDQGAGQGADHGAGEGGRRVTLAAFQDPAGRDYRLRPSGSHGPVSLPAPEALTPVSEYRHVRQLVPLAAGPQLRGAQSAGRQSAGSLLPGALQQ